MRLWWSVIGEKDIRFIDLFAGIGGFRRGLEQANESQHSDSIRHITNSYGGQQPHQFQHTTFNRRFKCVYTNEWDKYCTWVYNHNFGESIIPADIRKVEASSIPDFDLLCAGFPCQSFSIAGKRKGFDDTRGTMFFEIARMLEAKRPKMVLLENVKGLLSHRRGRTLHRILGALAELGYVGQYEVLNSKNFGVPQNRERVFIFGFRGEHPPQIFPLGQGGEEPDRAWGEAQKEGQWIPAIDSNYHKGGGTRGMISYAKEEPELKFLGGIMDEKSKMRLDDGKKNSRNYPQGRRVYSSEGISATLSSNGGGLGGKTGLYAVPVLTPDMSEIVAWSKSHRTGKSEADKKHHNYGKVEQRIKVGEANTLQTGEGGGPQSSQNFVMVGSQNPTVRAGGHGSIDRHAWDTLWEGKRIRRLTPMECERLQGFPDGWTEFGVDAKGNTVKISDSQRYRMMGNAVTTFVVQAIGEKMLEVLG